MVTTSSSSSPPPSSPSSTSSSSSSLLRSSSPWWLCLLLLASNANMSDGFSSLAASIAKSTLPSTSSTTATHVAASTPTTTSTVSAPLWTDGLLPPPPPPEVLESPPRERPPSALRLSWERLVCDLIRGRYHEARSASSAAFAGDASQSTPLPPPFMCAVVGIPGSGKTTSASILADMLSSTLDEGPDRACFLMPFDGYHIPLEQLRALPNAADAVYRRGAPDTFDADALVTALHNIRYGADPSLAIPGFDHAKGDPEEGQHTFNRAQHPIVIVEGLYLLHDQDGWERVAEYFDFTLYVDADLNVCLQRLKARNKCIPGYTPEEINLRVDVVDRANALTVQHSKSRAEIVVQSAAFE